MQTQENVNHKQKKNQLIETNLEMTRMMKLAVKDSYYMCGKEFKGIPKYNKRNRKCKKNQMKCLYITPNCVGFQISI